MSIIELLLKELETEAAITRKMLERVPADKFDWKPHEKSMNIKTLTIHIAELPSWVKMGLTTSELDFATMPNELTEAKDSGDLIRIFEKSLQEGKEALENAKEDDLWPSWVLRNGEQIYSTMTKYEVIRHSFAQTIHHRAQLGVFLRLLNIPIPGTYGPSADDMSF